jgi:type IV pilus assembly protein PilY1
LLGNLWRFDVNNTIDPSGYEAHKLVSLKDASDNPQPITAKPTVTTINNKPVIFIGTGRYLGVSDISNSQSQAFYAVKDSLNAVTLGNPRLSASNFVAQPAVSGTCPATANWCEPGQIVRLSSSNAVDWNTKNGWYMDFVTGGERSVTDSTIGLGTVLFTTISPNNSSANACGAETPDGSASFLYALDYLTGGAVEGTSGVSGISLGNMVATRPVMMSTGNGNIVSLTRGNSPSVPACTGPTCSTDLSGTLKTKPPIKASSGSTRRVSWRELVNE